MWAVSLMEEGDTIPVLQRFLSLTPYPDFVSLVHTGEVLDVKTLLPGFQT